MAQVKDYLPAFEGLGIKVESAYHDMVLRPEEEAVLKLDLNPVETTENVVIAEDPETSKRYTIDARGSISEILFVATLIPSFTVDMLLGSVNRERSQEGQAPIDVLELVEAIKSNSLAGYDFKEDGGVYLGKDSETETEFRVSGHYLTCK